MSEKLGGYEMITNEELERWLAGGTESYIRKDHVIRELLAARKVVEEFRDSLVTWDTDLVVGDQHPAITAYDAVTKGDGE